MSQQGSFLDMINIKTIILADGRHEGIFELHVSGLPINRLGVEHFEDSTAVAGVNTIHAKRDEPVLRVDVTTKEDGSIMSYDEIKVVANSLIQALYAWTFNLSAEQVDQFTRIREVLVEPVEGFVEHSEVSIHEMDGGRI